MYRIGIDVGGTFTDFTLIDERDGTVRFHKVPSTPSDPSEAIASGIADLMRLHDVDPAQIAQIGHGTTVATNLVIERKGARAGLITTQGFRDVLEIGRQVRPHLFDYSVTRAPAMVAREFRKAVPERIDARGNTLIELDRNAVRDAVAQFKAGGVETVAICLLHSYRNPAHEQAVKAIVQEQMPDVYVSVSSEVLPEFREFERLSTTVVNAAVGPRMQRYLDRFLERVKALGIGIEPFTVHSNGGLMSIGTVRSFPVRTCLSGPAAGVVGAAEIGRAAGFPNLVTFDVGGTSTDVSLIHGGKPLFSSNAEVAGYPVKTPMIDIHVIGAGGGSIAWMDDAGSLKVGPHSAGAVPGPVGYARGGTQPTITDAELTLQRLNPVALLNGRMKVDVEAARRVITERVAKPLRLSVEDASEGIIHIANANMSRAIRSVSTERGYDLSDFALFAFGGAGPLHATEVAEECGIPVVIVPQEPGTLCARGILLSDVSFDFVRTQIALLDAESWRRVCSTVSELKREADAWLARERVAAGERSFRCFIEARYEGQNFEVIVPMDEVVEGSLDAFIERFHNEHKREYGYEVRDRGIEIVNCRLQGVGRLVKPPHRAPAGAGDAQAARTGHRRVYHGKRHGWLETPVYDRTHLAAGAVVNGPAVVEEMSSTTVLAPGHVARADALGNLVIRLDGSREAK
jgi:N-methylhydantoinase A